MLLTYNHLGKLYFKAWSKHVWRISPILTIYRELQQWSRRFFFTVRTVNHQKNYMPHLARHHVGWDPVACAHPSDCRYIESRFEQYHRIDGLFNQLELWPFISYNWLFLWDYTFYKWGFVSTYINSCWKPSTRFKWSIHPPVLEKRHRPSSRVPRRTSFLQALTGLSEGDPGGFHHRSGVWKIVWLMVQ
jgi:hypothetical protein